MSFLPLSGSTTSLSTAHSEYSTEVSDTTGYTSEGRRNSFYYVKGNSSAGGNGNERRVDAGEDEDEMREFLLGPGWVRTSSLDHQMSYFVCGTNPYACFRVQRDDRVPPAERMKQLYHLLEEHYDLTGGDYYGQCAYHSCGTIGSFRRTSKLVDYPIVCVSYLASIGVNLDLLLGDSNKVSSDPMNDLIDEAFCRPASLYLRYKAGPFSTWEVDWDRPLPQVTHGYWNMMRVS